jgi:hypothetical protein
VLGLQNLHNSTYSIRISCFKFEPQHCYGSKDLIKVPIIYITLLIAYTFLKFTAFELGEGLCNLAGRPLELFKSFQIGPWLEEEEEQRKGGRVPVERATSGEVRGEDKFRGLTAVQ